MREISELTIKSPGCNERISIKESHQRAIVSYKYAVEGLRHIINVALFNSMTKQWREENHRI